MFERIESELRYELLALAGRQDARELKNLLYRRLGLAAVADALEIDLATLEDALPLRESVQAPVRERAAA